MKLITLPRGVKQTIQSQPRAGDAELSHAMLQRGALQSQPDGSAVGSAEDPICVLQNSQDVLSLGFLQRLLRLRIGRRCTGLQLGQWCSQRASRRQDHGPLDHILQFANIAGPVVAAESIHGFTGGSIDGLFHALAEVLNEMSGQQGNIFLALPEGRQMDGKDV